MSSSLHPRRSLHESVPVATVVVLWSLVAWFVAVLGADPVVSTGLRYAGLVLGSLYAVGIGYDLAESVPGGAATTDSGAVLEQSLIVFLPAAVWFCGALLVGPLAAVWEAFGVPGLFSSPAGALSFGFAATGVLTVLLQAVALAAASAREEPSPALGGETHSNDRPEPDVTSGSD
jgi:hypothetical protein